MNEFPYITAERIQQVFAEYACMDVGDVKLTDTVENFAFDSLDMVEIFMEIEEQINQAHPRIELMLDRAFDSINFHQMTVMEFTLAVNQEANKFAVSQTQ